MKIQINAAIQTPHYIIEAQFDGTFTVRGRYGNEKYRSEDFPTIESALYAVDQAESILEEVENELEQVLMDHSRAVALLN